MDEQLRAYLAQLDPLTAAVAGSLLKGDIEGMLKYCPAPCPSWAVMLINAVANGVRLSEDPDLLAMAHQDLLDEVSNVISTEG